MILCDTNVISEFMGSRPNEVVLNWLNQQDPTTLFISSISIAEIHYGLQLLPAGKRRTRLEQAFSRFSTLAFANRVLVFNTDAAAKYGELRASRRQAGKPMSTMDAQIAAIASTNDFSVATRNTADFVDCGVQLINPFEGGS